MTTSKSRHEDDGGDTVEIGETDTGKFRRVAIALDAGDREAVNWGKGNKMWQPAFRRIHFTAVWLTDEQGGVHGEEEGPGHRFAFRVSQLLNIVA